MSSWTHTQSGLIVPVGYTSDAGGEGALIPAQSAQVRKKAAKEPPMSHSEAREAFARELEALGCGPERAAKLAYETSVRVCRKEGYKL